MRSGALCAETSAFLLGFGKAHTYLPGGKTEGGEKGMKSIRYCAPRRGDHPPAPSPKAARRHSHRKWTPSSLWVLRLASHEAGRAVQGQACSDDSATDRAHWEDWEADGWGRGGRRMLPAL